VKRAGKWVKRIGVGLLAVTGAGFAWYYNRPHPSELHEEIFRGVTYHRTTTRDPRPNVIHIVEIDLDKARPRIETTSGQPDNDLPFKADTISEFVKKTGVQLAINGSFFTPWWSNGIFDYYPHSGDPLRTKGLAVHEGQMLCPEDDKYPAIYFDSQGTPSFRPPEHVYNALAGEAMFLVGGKYALAGTKDRYHTGLQPRTAIGLSVDRRKMILLVVDGRQPRYSEGVTLRELADIASANGVHTGLNLDGGGSTALVIQGENGYPQQLNSPIDKRIPGRERPIANHLGLFLERLPAEPQ
jgi:hypothetical protein